MSKLITLLASFCLCNFVWADTTTDTTAPIAAYESFYNLLLQKNYPDAYKLLSTPTRQAFERMAKALKEIEQTVAAMPDSNPEKAMANKVLEALSSMDGPTLFVQIIKLSVPETEKLPPYQPPKDLKITGTLANGHTARGFPIMLYKESGNWLVDLNSGALNLQCQKLEDYLNQLKPKGK